MLSALTCVLAEKFKSLSAVIVLFAILISREPKLVSPLSVIRFVVSILPLTKTGVILVSVLILIFLLETSKYIRSSSNAKSLPFLVRLSLRSCPEILPSTFAI